MTVAGIIGSRSSSSDRYANSSAQAAKRAVRKRDVATVRSGDVPGDRETQARSALVLVSRLVQAIERTKHVLPMGKVLSQCRRRRRRLRGTAARASPEFAHDRRGVGRWRQDCRRSVSSRPGGANRQIPVRFHRVHGESHAVARRPAGLPAERLCRSLSRLRSCRHGRRRESLDVRAVSSTSFSGDRCRAELSSRASESLKRVRTSRRSWLTPFSIAVRCSVARSIRRFISMKASPACLTSVAPCGLKLTSRPFPKSSAACASLKIGRIWLRRKMIATVRRTIIAPSIQRTKICAFAS